MRKVLVYSVLFLAGLLLCFGSQAQESGYPWTKKQLKAPADLALELQLPQQKQPVLIDMGPAGTIKGAKEIGPAEYDKNKKLLKDFLKDIPKSKEVVVYCGCCPFLDCPNAAPAFQILLDMGFKKPRLLNLPHNLKVDWIDKGYPLEQSK